MRCKKQYWEKFIVINTLIKIKKDSSQITNLNLYLKWLKKQEEAKLKVSRRKEITKFREEIKEQKAIEIKLRVGILKT